jgi:methylase of polypeptide subunit release factors
MLPSAGPVLEQRCRFGPLAIHYDERVLTPRPWTLVQSSWAAQLAATAAPGPILELCAGAGQIGLAAAVLADRDLVQVEADAVAAGYACANAARAGRADRVEVRAAPLETALQADERFPLILADPPYLRPDQTQRWRGDPITAIDGGPDGLDVTRACLRTAVRHLVPGGWLLLQVAGPAQAAEVARLVAADGPLVPVELRVEDDERAVQLLRG